MGPSTPNAQTQSSQIEKHQCNHSFVPNVYERAAVGVVRGNVAACPHVAPQRCTYSLPVRCTSVAVQHLSAAAVALAAHTIDNT